MRFLGRSKEALLIRYLRASFSCPPRESSVTKKQVKFGWGGISFGGGGGGGTGLAEGSGISCVWLTRASISPKRVALLFNLMFKIVQSNPYHYTFQNNMQSYKSYNINNKIEK